MATLNKIRSKGTMLLIVVGIALAAFIIGDFFGSATSALESHEVAIIDGDEIKAMDYMQTIDQMQKVYELETGSTGLNEETTNQLRESVWETTIRTNVIGKEAAKIGMQVTKDELVDLTVGNNISPIISARRMFINENGIFDVNTLLNFISIVYSNNNTQIPASDIEMYKSYWQFWEKMVKNTRLEEKYVNLISNAIVVTPLEAKYYFESKQKSYDVVYAMKNYFAIPDSTINVTSSEISALYNKKKEQFKQEANADIKYVVFNIRPAQDDYNKIEKLMSDIKPEFAKTNDIAVVTNSISDITYTGVNLAKNDIDTDLADFAFSASKDSIVGPFLSNNTFKMARIVENNITSPDSVRLRSIAIVAESEERTQIVADSIMEVLKNGGDFAAIALKHSVAQNAKLGGEIGWIREIEVTNNIANQAFTAKANSFFQTKDGQAIIIFNVQELGANVAKVKLAVVSIVVTASSRTQASIYGEAKKFASSTNNNLAILEANAKRENIQVYNAQNISINANKVNNINHSREIVRWAFKNKQGNVSDVIECDDKLVVAAVENIYEKGYKTIEQMNNSLSSEIRKDKKGEKLIAEMKGKTLDQLQMEGFTVDTIRNINFNSPYLGSIGNEPTMPAIVGSLGDKLSNPIKGNMGAYVFKVINTTENPIQYNEKEEILILGERQKYMANYLIIETLKKTAEIEDLRYKYF